MEDEKLKNRLSNELFKTVKSNFTWKKTTEKIIKDTVGE